ncbi:NAD(P)-dependent alcohol dehydrogenase [Cryobacterium mannosilyticum]|nr:NAD(P)-dependent alcohol dehydrogenase [Cryobacterium mannosilyticum]
MTRTTHSSRATVGEEASPEPVAPDQTMEAIVQRRYGSPAVLGLERVDRPRIGDDDLLIRVRAAAVNHADWVLTTGRPLIGRLAFGLRRPKERVRGMDVAGLVEAVGAGVTGFRPGDEVYAQVPAGGFAEFTRAPAALVSPMPANLSFEQAATVPLAANTALQGLRDAGGLRAGQRVLVNGASGGVGSFAVQIARALGAEVTGVCSARNVDLVRSIGADEVIDYTRHDFTANGRRYDLILDLIGNHPVRSCIGSLTPAGTLVLSSGTGGRVLGPLGRVVGALVLSRFVSQSVRTFVGTPSRENLDLLRTLIESGKVTPVVDRSYPLRDVPEAIRHFAEVHARGKIAVTL